METLKDIQTRLLIGSRGCTPDLDMVDRRDLRCVAIRRAKQYKKEIEQSESKYGILYISVETRRKRDVLHGRMKECMEFFNLTMRDVI